MASPKSGKACTQVSPTDAKEVTDADTPDPVDIAEIKKDQIEKKAGKYGSTPAPPFKPADSGGGGGAAGGGSSSSSSDADSDDKDDEKKLHWIEIELKDEQDEPVAGEKYQITLPNGTVAEGTTDADGKAKIEGIEESGDATIAFPDVTGDPDKKA